MACRISAYALLIAMPLLTCAPSSHPAFAENAPAATQPSRYFTIQVLDDQTSRGVPLVELKTVSNVRLYTDSAGLVAIDDPALFGREVFFTVSSHGYEFPKDGFGFRGQRLTLTPGGSAKLKIKRLNIAERLYRTTGEGIYRDSVMLNRPVPIKEPLLNAQVTGQDSALSIVYRGKIRWFYGDTNRQSYPLGHFSTSGAISALPEDGGLDPSTGVNLEYFTGPDGFSRGVLPPSPGKPSWLDGLMVLSDEKGNERMLATSSIMKRLGQCLARQLVVWNDQKNAFDVLKEIPMDVPLFPVGHPFRVNDGPAQYLYCGQGWPNIRVKADWKTVQDFASYEAFTCLIPGSRYDRNNVSLDRDKEGRLIWAWKKNTGVLDVQQVASLLRSGKLKPDEAWFNPKDADSRQRVTLAMGSVTYNAFRKKWIMIADQLGGDTSHLGEVWYAESDKPEGPWPWARKIITHDRYSFYNPVQHPFFEQQGGRIIYFEGTYTTTFSRDDDPTPRYDYNQIMYRLDLGDAKLKLPE
ncbi:MAG: hypothetical protein JWN24_68 [Phycisphaerales bacterium]|nr:hypothetical protein [Phycisphaerales bacterium]